MNPFMERTWPDVHVRMINQVLDLLGLELPEDLSAKGELHVNVLGGEAAGYRPDIAVIEDSWKSGLPPVWVPEGAANTGPLVDEPLLVEVEEAPHRWVEIRSDDGQLVTVIEVLSPANKRHHREAYISKRGDYVAAGVNVVEIDLLRSGPVTVDVVGFDYQRQKPGLGEHYLICASRGVKPGRREIYPCPLRQRLPVIRIPLRPTDPDVPLEVQALINHCYTSGRYWKLDYTVPLDPPLSVEDAVWVKGVLEGDSVAGKPEAG
jgi:hypothetical protein